MADSELFEDGGEATTPEAATPDAPATPEANPAEGDGYEHEALKGMFKGKYKTFADIEKGYSESSKQAREFQTAAEKAEERWKAIEPIIGAPVDAEGKPAPYDFKVPEEVTIMPELMDAFQADLREMNLGPAVGQKVLDRYIAVEAGMETARREVERDFVVQTLGAGDEAVAKAAVNETLTWVRSTLGDAPEIEEMLTGNGGAASYGKTLTILAQLRARMNGASMGASSGTSGFNDSDYRALLSKQARGPLTQEEQTRMVGFLNARTPDDPRE